MNDEEIEKKLFEVYSEDVKNNYTEHLIDQYKIYIESAEKISDRRLETNKFFLTLNTAVIGLFGFIEAKNPGQITFVLTLGSFVGVIISYYWFRIIESYKGLNTGKFKVVHMIEKRLPLSLYETEWEVLGQGKDNKKYRPFTHIEVKIPILRSSVFGYLYCVYSVGNHNLLF